jgi:hypothetical protein
MQDGGHGFEMPGPSPVQKWLADRSPSEVAEALQWQASLRGVELKAERKPVYTRNALNEPVLDHYEISHFTANGTKATQEGADELVAKVEATFAPPSKQMCEEWLAELSVITARRPDDEMTEALRLEAYAIRLVDYPTDIAKHAILGHRWKFWPTWAEVAEICDAALDKRKKMLLAVSRMRVGPVERIAPPPPVEVDHEARKAAAEEVVTKAGFTLERWQRAQKDPMARTTDELMDPKYVSPPHWADNLPPDHPEMVALRRARQTNDLMRQSMAKE